MNEHADEQHRMYMAQAIELARENVRSGTGGPFAAIVVRDNRVLASGTNRVTAENDPTAHAEVLAIRGACRTVQDFQLTGAIIYTTCEPCPMCLGAIYWARIDRIYFAASRIDAATAGFDDHEIYEEIMTPHHERRIPITQLSREASLDLFKEWGDDESKIKY